MRSGRAGLSFRDGLLRALKVGGALNIYPWALSHQNLKGLAVPSAIINCRIGETWRFWERPREMITVIGWGAGAQGSSRLSSNVNVAHYI